MSDDYDHSIHSNPDAAAWAKLFTKTFPPGGSCPDEATMLGWFANAMMAIHDHVAPETTSFKTIPPDAPPSTEPTPITPVEARICVFREVAAFLEKNIETAEAHLADLYPDGAPPAPDSVSVKAANIASATLAALELKDSLLITAHKLEKAITRPRILRPERSIKIAR